MKFTLLSRVENLYIPQTLETAKTSLLQDLIYNYPEELVAQTPQWPPRVLRVDSLGPCEITFSELLNLIPPGDVLVINDTKVLKRRVFASGLEILFLTPSVDRQEWEVLFPSKDLKVGAEIELPGGVKMTLLQKGRPQRVGTSKPLEEHYFQTYAELPLPPYIQKARGERHNVTEDSRWYQTPWAEKPGSLAAPTASLHFRAQDLETLRGRGVFVETLTLHVGLGTFLPLTQDNLKTQTLHEEWVDIPEKTWTKIQEMKSQGKKVWALGTTVTRSLESAALKNQRHFQTDLFILPGFSFQIVDHLLTNFHQPGSSLLALVMAFAGKDKTQKAYQKALEQKFRLFSYGDFSLWTR